MSKTARALLFRRANARLPQHALDRGTGPDDDDDNGYAEEPCRLC